MQTVSSPPPSSAVPVPSVSPAAMHAPPVSPAAMHTPPASPPAVPVAQPEALSGIGVYPTPNWSHPYRPVPPYTVTPFRRDARIMPARTREVALAVALVVLADLALLGGSDVALRGAGGALFFVLVPALLIIGARARRLTLRLGAIVAMLAAVAARCAYSPNGSSVALGVVGVFAVAITIRMRAAFLTDVAASFGATFATIPLRLVGFVRGVSRTCSSRGPSSGLFASVSIPFALVSAFIGIFALANPLVRRWLAAMGGSAELPALVRVVLWIPLLFGAVLLVRPGLRRTLSPENLDETTASTRASLRVARNALLALNAVFLGYNVLDAKYLWAGSPPPGVSERAYAHEGAAWLTVAILALTAVVGVLFRGALAHDARARFARVLAFVWLAQGGVVALGTYRRLWIHIGASGLSSLRILGIVGTSLVVVGLLQMAWKLSLRRSFFWLLRRQMDAVAIGLFAFAITPTHRMSAPLNVRRVLAHDYQALVHAEEEVQEVESATAMLPLLHHDDLRIRRGIAALLLDERDALRAKAAHGGLRDLELAAPRTLATLEAATPEIEDVLGDVDRYDAVTPFEYIRNSSIEGAIAESEISKVLPAPTRPEKAVAEWVPTRVDVRPLSSQPFGLEAIRATDDPNRLEATLWVTWTKAPSAATSQREVFLTIERDKDSPKWRVSAARGKDFELESQ